MTKTSSNQLFMLFFVFFIGSTMAFVGNGIAGRDSWVSIIIGTFLASFIYLIYIRIFRIYKNDSLIDINLKIFGKKKGKFINYIYGFFAFLSALNAVMMNSFFINTISLIDTKIIVITSAVAIVCFVVAFNNSEAIAKFPQIVGALIFVIIIFSLSLSISTIEIENLLPTFEMGWDKILEFSYTTMMVPFLEGFFVLAMFYKGEKKQVKIIISSIFLAGVLLLLTTLRNLLVFGYPAIKGLYYPSYSALSIISFGDFFQREEVFVSIVFAICYVLKPVIFLCFSAKAINIKNYKTSLAIIVVLIIISSCFVKSIMLFFDYILIYIHMLVFPLLVLPILTWILAEMKKGEKNGT